ncbi:hypothetical protein [Burkholderia ubonensis]|uniref:hypothetical protein n=1 Tax=Burkholderia ubonensis TaxID=101571 RepID=UPI001454605D|nr:hypothetical protein [Burkholderia ubonensis]VWC06415.1 LysM domain-containing protein [Burkholderia ubonensis]
MAQTWPSTFYSAFYDVLSRFRSNNVDAGLTAFRTYLNNHVDNPRVRVFVDGTKGFGHQVSSINIVRRLTDAVDAAPIAGFEYGGTIEIRYTGDAPTLAKIREQLLPDAGWNGNTGHLGNATLQLAANLPGDGDPVVNLGFTGGADDRNDLGVRMRTRYFLLLQPYRWAQPNEIQFDNPNWPSIDLQLQNVLGRAGYAQRAFFQDVQPLTANQWQTYIGAGGEAGTRAQILQWLTDDAQLNDFDLVPVYGIRAPAFCEMGRPASERIVQLVAGYLDSQFEGNAPAQNARPIVIVNLDTYDPPASADNNGFPYVIALLDGSATSSENIYLPKVKGTDRIDVDDVTNSGIRAYNARRKYLLSLNANHRSDFLWQNVTLQAVQNFVKPIRGHNDRVHFIQLGIVPQPVFNDVFANNTLPSVFEGQNTANLALNLGRPYFHVARPGTNDIQYPTTTLGYPEAAGQLPTRLQNIANQIHLDLSAWPVAGMAPPAVIGQFVRTWRGEAQNGEYHRYFRQIRDFYHAPANDKLNLGINYLNYVINGRAREQALRLGREPVYTLLEDGGALTLDQLHANLRNAIEASGNETLDLAAPTLYDDGLIAQILGALVRAVTGQAGALTVKVGSLDREPNEGDIQRIKLSGATSFFGLPTKVDVAYTAPENKVMAVATFTAAQNWSIDAAPWIVFSGPYVQFTLSNASIPSVGAIGGSLQAGPTGFDFALQLPGEENTWLFQADFPDGKRPGIDLFYSLAGGINLVQVLPPPFNVLADVGLSQLELQYDFANNRVGYLAFTMKTSQSVPLFGNIALQDLTIQTTINNPASLKERKWVSTIQGEFAIGGNGRGVAPALPGIHTDAPAQPAIVQLAAVVPTLNFEGNLVSGQINVLDLINQFIPGTPLPTGLSPVITDFNFSYTYGNGNLSSGMNMNTDFKFPSADNPVFTLEGLNFNLARESGNTLGGIGAKVILFQSDSDPDSEIPLDIGAQYRGSTLGWTFSATQSGNGVYLDKLLARYFGPNWVADQVKGLGFADLSITLQTGTSSWQFSGRTAEPWQIPFLPGLPPIGANVLLGYNGPSSGKPASRELLQLGNDSGIQSFRYAHREMTLAADGPGALPGSTVPGQPLNGWRLLAAEQLLAGEPGLFGKIGLNIYFNNIPATVFFNFSPDARSFGLTWGVLSVTVEEKAPDAAHLSLPGVGVVRPDADVLMAVAADPQKHWIATFTLADKSLGEMVEMLISWATRTEFGLGAPWNLLNHIPLSAFALQWDFSTNQVTFKVNIGPINLGFATIKSIGVNYDSQSTRDRKVNVSLEGSFMWDVKPQEGVRFDVAANGDQRLTWDATKPEQTPAPPGGGNKYLDLRLLALGQRVSIGGLAQLDTVEKLVAKLRDLPNNAPDAIPVGGPGQPYFDAGSSWLIATNFGVLKVEDGAQQGKAAANDASLRARLPIGMPLPTGRELIVLEQAKPEYFLDLSIVFNDPKLYALRVALAGPAAKILAGLAFEIMYRQVSDTVGVYSSRLSLPTAMRRLDFGTFTITLPEFGIEIFTNGDFKVDVGFPYNEDFSVSFTIEAIVYPGIPLLGSAGFYFGKLSSETSSDVPQASNGWFNPVIVVGFGAQLGVGKSVSVGILEAGFSITAFGIIQGVIAQWHYYDGSNLPVSKNQVQDSYYFAISGTFGILGRLYGTINFAIVQANVDITVKAMASIVYMSYRDIPISVSAGVSVRVSVKINLGLFKISISFSFSATVKATFVIANSGRAPWNTLETDRGQLRLRRMQARLRAYQERMGLLQSTTYAPVWSRLRGAAAPVGLQGYFAPALTVAGDAAQASGDLSKQFAAYVLSFFIATQPPVSGANATEVHQRRLTLQQGDDPFKTLTLQVTRWLIAAGQSADMTAAAVDDLVVSDVFLSGIYDYLGNARNTSPIPAGDINDFLNAQFSIDFKLQVQAGEADAVFFPAAPWLNIKVPAYGNDYPGIDYLLANYNATSPDYAQWLRKYFQELAVSVQQEGANAAVKFDLAGDSGPAVASFVFQDYFTLIGRQMVDSLRSGLRNFQYVLRTGQSIADIVDTINTTGRLSGDAAITAADLFAANPRHPLTKGSRLGIQGSTFTTPAGLGFSDIAALTVFRNAAGQPLFDGKSLAGANLAAKSLLQPGAVVTYPGKPDYRVQPDDSLERIAVEVFQVAPDAMLTHSNVVTLKDLLIPLATLSLPAFEYQSVEGDNLNAVAARFSITLDDLSGVARNVTGIPGLFDASAEPYLDVPHLTQYRVGDLLDEAVRTLAVQHLGSMASRYYLHGLRVPTNGVTPRQPGIFVSGTSPNLTLPAEIGLFALVGQEIALPALTDGDVFNFTVSAANGSNWLRFTTDQQTRNTQAAQAGSAPSLTFELSNADDLARVRSVVDYASRNRLFTNTSLLGPGAESELHLASYAFESQTVWQSGGPVPLPVSLAPAPQVPALNIWGLSPAMASLPGASRAVAPAFRIDIGRYDEATGQMAVRQIRNVGFGSIVRFRIKRVPPVATSPSTERTYEILGAGTTDILMLERILSGVSSDAAYFAVDLLFPQGGTSGQPALRSYARPDTVFGISQVNLSTVTRPPSGAVLTAARSERVNPGLLNAPGMFLRLLWEASITRAGGFFLYFDAIAEDQGLPDAIFNDQGEAEVAVLALYQAKGDTQQGWLELPDYVNCVVTDEATDSGQDQVYAQAVARPVTALLPEEGQSLGEIASAYFTDAPGIVMENLLNGANPDTRLRSGAEIVIENGLYQVPPQGEAPGGDLDAIAAWFGVTAAQIRQANPRIGTWPPVLPPLVAIRLPRIIVKVGASHGGDTLVSLSNYYRVPLQALAAANADRVDILAAGATLDFSTGPIHRSAGNRVGVVAYDLMRAVPPEIPDRPTGDYAQIYLQHVFNMLGYATVETVDFRASNMGLPAGPANSDDGMALFEKVRAPGLLEAGENWDYTQSIPYNGLAKEQPTLALGAAESDVSPYAGVGGLLQTDFAWYDLYGNTMVSQLSAPQKGDAAPLNRPPAITGYTDALLGPGQWPAVSVAYQLAGGNGTPVGIAFVFAFDYNRYKPYDPQNGTGDDAWKENAARDLHTYQVIHYQLQDPNGIGMEVESTLLTGAPPELTDAQAGAITNWAYQVQAFLHQRANGDQSATPPAPLDLVVPVDTARLNPALLFELSMDFVISRRADLVAGALRNVPGIGSVRTAVSPYTGNLENYNNPADTRSLTQFAQDLTRALAGLGAYAYQACVGTDRAAPPEAQAKQRVWITRLGTTNGKAPAEAISYRVRNPSQPVQYAPRPLSNQLVSRAVRIYGYTTGTGIDFDTPTRMVSFTDMDADRWLLQFLSQVDALLSPRFVSPALILDNKCDTRLLQALLDAKEHLAAGLKTLMIAVFKDQNPDAAATGDAQDGFRQMMLDRLANGFNVAAAVQFSVDVNADIAQRYPHVPRLYGTIAPAADRSGVEAEKNVSLTTPKLDLRTTKRDAPANLTFMVSTSEHGTRTADTIPLDVVYQGRYIEHQIGEVPGISDGNDNGYLASSWLSFLNLPTDATPGDWPLDQALGSFNVPLVLREYPQIPVMVQQQSLQTGRKPADGDTDVDALIRQAKQWNYGFTYSLQQHRLQDRIHCAVTFNIKDSLSARNFAETRDLFDDLGEFITVYPAVEKDLNIYLATITEATTDKIQLKNAQTALDSAVQLVARAAQSAQVPTIRRAASLHARALQTLAEAGTQDAPSPDLPYAFIVSESSRSVEAGGQGPVDALMITIAGKPPAGIGAPVVNIEGYRAERQGDEDDVFSYLYTKDGHYLDVETGAAIPDRQVELPALDILVRQDALSELHLTRNESFGGRATADPFVYSTPDVKFTGPLHPTNAPDAAIDMSLIGQGNNGKHVKRSLSGHLQALFDALFADTALQEQLIQVTFFYEYATNDALSPIRLPVYHLPQQAIRIGGTPDAGQIGLERLIEILSGKYQAWKDRNQASGNRAVLRFDLTILSGLTRQPAPVLVLGNVFVDLKDVGQQ